MKKLVRKTFPEKRAIMLREANFVKGLIHGADLKESKLAFNVMKKYHTGTKRKDGLDYDTHPIRVTNHLLSLGVRDDHVIAAALLHDVIEDCNVDATTLVNTYGFSNETMTIISKVTKPVNSKKDETEMVMYYYNIGTSVGAILVKIADRLHNLSTMHGVFSKEKMGEYVEETYTYILPLCRTLKYNYPEYANVSYVIKNQIETICEIYDSFLSL